MVIMLKLNMLMHLQNPKYVKRKVHKYQNLHMVLVVSNPPWRASRGSNPSKQSIVPVLLV